VPNEGLTRLIYFLKPVYFKRVATILKHWKNARNSVYHLMARINQENPEGLTDIFSPF
jgi:response regulator of citrate/malate metabolism